MAEMRRTDRLDPYRSKRSAERTPEPFRSAPASRPRLYVVQMHAARRLHHDFRLEWNGTLWSWAVPHGPSLDSSEKRLAVHVEDHPVEYADFEGIIPEGNYGAGEVIVWDRGVWLPFDDPDEGMRKGRLHFELRGYKLRGTWTLVRTKSSPKDWLLIKKADAFAVPKGVREPPAESILSGLTLEELRDGNTRAAEVRAELEKRGAPRRRVDPRRASVMLAETADEPFSRPGWVFELKYDGYRLLAARQQGGEPLLQYRSGSDVTWLFPDLARTLRAQPYDNLVLDGEAVVLDPQGRPDFHRLQQRARLRQRAEIERATVEMPVTLFVFDLLGFEDFDLRPLALEHRKAILRRLLPGAGPLRYSEHIETRGQDFFEQVSQMGLEGIMAKKADAPYRAGRSGLWLKVLAARSGDFVICGYTAPQGSRAGFGALHLGVYDAGRLVYAGRVGTGFSDKQLEALRTELEALRIPKPPCEGEVPRTRGNWWVKPERVVEVRYKAWTDDGHLRHPVFLRLRDDKRPDECVRTDHDTMPDTAEAEPPAASPSVSKRASSAAPRAEPPEERRVALTHLDKVFWPRDGITKGELIEYYRAVSPWLLPYLRDRPVVLTRFPDGIEGKSFYQKNAPGFAPAWVRTESIWSEHAQREIDYFVADDETMLVYLVNSGTIPLHVWSSRVASLQQPDWCILDLDPKGAPFEHVVRLALAIRELCESIGLEPFVKTTGSTGLHVLLPLGGQCTYEQSRSLGLLIARLIEQQHGDISTTARVIGARGGRVYLDYLQNRHGQLLVAPYSVRPLPGAPVSAPLHWREVNRRLGPQQYTLRTLPKRLAKLREDPLLPVLATKPDLAQALRRLGERLQSAPATAPSRRKSSRVSKRERK